MERPARPSTSGWLDDAYARHLLPLSESKTYPLHLATSCILRTAAQPAYADSCRCYLPDATVFRAVQQRPRLKWRRDARALKRAIAERQRGCNASHYLRTPGFMNAGLGKMLMYHVMVDLKQVWLASEENWRSDGVQRLKYDARREDVFKGGTRPGAILLARHNTLNKWTTADGSMPCTTWYGCYWMPLRARRCTELAVEALARDGGGGGSAAGGGGRRQFDRNEEAKADSSNPLMMPFLAPGASALERAWGPFFLHVALLDAWWRPTPAFAGQMRAGVEGIFGRRLVGATGGGSDDSARDAAPEGGCIAMHVRRGDACTTKWRHCPSLESYLAPARLMARRYGLRSLFVSTDDESVVANLTRSLPLEPWKRLHVQAGMNRSAYTPPHGCSGRDCWVEERMINKRRNSLGDANPVLNVLTDVEAGARCDAFVGSFDASISVLMLSRMVARLGAVPPFYSVGGYLCDHMNSDIGPPYAGDCPNLFHHPVPPPPDVEKCSGGPVDLAEYAPPANTLGSATAGRVEEGNAGAGGQVETEAWAKSGTSSAAPTAAAMPRGVTRPLLAALLNRPGRFDLEWGLPFACFAPTVPGSVPFTTVTQLLPQRGGGHRVVALEGVTVPVCDATAASLLTAASSAAVLRRLGEHGARVASCENRSALLAVRPVLSGWFSVLHSVVKVAMHALKGGRTLLSPQLDAWVPAGHQCAARDLSCFFEPLAPACDGPSRGRGAVETLELPNWVDFQDLSRLVPLRSHRYDRLVPAAHRDIGWFGWTSLVAAHLLRPSRRLRRELLKRLASTGLGAALVSSGSPVVGLHVRHGDACEDGHRTARSCSPLSEYLARAEAIRAATGARTFYLATDSPAVAREAESFFGANLTLIRSGTALETMEKVQERARRRGVAPSDPSRGANWDEILQFNHAHGYQEDNWLVAWESTLEVFLLSMCDAFIGKFTSNVFRAAYELHGARCNCVAPFASLDAPWCFDWNVFAGFSPGRGWFPC